MVIFKQEKNQFELNTLKIENSKSTFSPGPFPSDHIFLDCFGKMAG